MSTAKSAKPVAHAARAPVAAPRARFGWLTFRPALAVILLLALLVRLALRAQSGGLAYILAMTGDPAGAVAEYRRATEIEPNQPLVHVHVSEILAAQGDFSGALAALRQAHALAPDDRAIANNLAWYLATLPGLPSGDRDAALRLARQATAGPDGRHPDRLDTLAAALAACGRFAEAVRAAEDAARLAERQGGGAAAQRIRQRTELYKAGRPYIMAPPGSAPTTRP
ncbi:MAG: tetratricopeptide repeat protein [Planctomycetota bacterium]